MPKSGTQVVLCDLPIRLDTYKGCSHGCEYCFAKKKFKIEDVGLGEGPKALQAWLGGFRNQDCRWCDWDIPIHWGGLSDPFQPAETRFGRSLECLKLLSATDHPFIVSTKSLLPLTEPYAEQFARANVVVQMSLVAPYYDQYESGAPTFEARRDALADFVAISKRVIVRIQPYALGLVKSVLRELPKYAKAGVYGVTIEGLKRQKSAPGMVRVVNDRVYPVAALKRDFSLIRHAAREEGMAFFAAENRLRHMGDDPCCCGVAGLPGFVPNRANLNHCSPDRPPVYTERMKQPKTGAVMYKLPQTTIASRVLREMSFADAMELFRKTKTAWKIMGKDIG